MALMLMHCHNSRIKQFCSLQNVFFISLLIKYASNLLYVSSSKALGQITIPRGSFPQLLFSGKYSQYSLPRSEKYFQEVAKLVFPSTSHLLMRRLARTRDTKSVSMPVGDFTI